MADDDLTCSVRFGFEVNCDGDDLDDYVIGIEGVVSVHLDLSEPGSGTVFEQEEVGRVFAYEVQTTQAENDGISLYDICDAHSSDLKSVFAALFDVELAEPKEELDVSPTWEGLLYLDRIVVEPEYRNRGVVVSALETTIRSFCPRGVIAAHPHGMGLTVDEWRELGFVKIAGSDVIFRDNASLNPYGRSNDEE